VPVQCEYGFTAFAHFIKKELQSLLCVEQQSTVLSDTWSRRDSNKIDSGEEGTVIKLRPEKKEL